MTPPISDRHLGCIAGRGAGDRERRRSRTRVAQGARRQRPGIGREGFGAAAVAGTEVGIRRQGDRVIAVEVAATVSGVRRARAGSDGWSEHGLEGRAEDRDRPGLATRDSGVVSDGRDREIVVRVLASDEGGALCRGTSENPDVRRTADTPAVRVGIGEGGRTLGGIIVDRGDDRCQHMGIECLGRP